MCGDCPVPTGIPRGTGWNTPHNTQCAALADLVFTVSLQVKMWRTCCWRTPFLLSWRPVARQERSDRRARTMWSTPRSRSNWTKAGHPRWGLAWHVIFFSASSVKSYFTDVLRFVFSRSSPLKTMFPRTSVKTTCTRITPLANCAWRSQMSTCSKNCSHAWKISRWVLVMQRAKVIAIKKQEVLVSFRSNVLRKSSVRGPASAFCSFLRESAQALFSRFVGEIVVFRESSLVHSGSTQLQLWFCRVTSRKFVSENTPDQKCVLLAAHLRHQMGAGSSGRAQPAVRGRGQQKPLHSRRSGQPDPEFHLPQQLQWEWRMWQWWLYFKMKSSGDKLCFCLRTRQKFSVSLCPLPLFSQVCVQHSLDVARLLSVNCSTPIRDPHPGLRIVRRSILGL